MKRHFLVSALFVMSAMVAGAQVSTEPVQAPSANDNAAGQEAPVMRSKLDRSKKPSGSQPVLQQANDPKEAPNASEDNIPAREEKPVGDGKMIKAKSTIDMQR